MSLPGTIKVESTRGDHERPVRKLGAIDVPSGSPYGDCDGVSLDESSPWAWDGYRSTRVESHLRTWTPPERVREITERVERALEEGIPDQRRTMVRNQEDGMLDDRWIDEIARGEDVENPFMRWTRQRRGETRVAICLDGTVAHCDSVEMLEARMCVAAGLAAALEGLDYECSILAATLLRRTAPYDVSAPRMRPETTEVFATIAKEEGEPFVESGVAHFAGTGLRRLVLAWTMESNGICTQLTDREWRELTGADLFIYVGSRKENAGRGRPSASPVGPQGDDVVYLEVNARSDIDGAIGTLERFFVEQCGE